MKSNNQFFLKPKLNHIYLKGNCTYCTYCVKKPFGNNCISIYSYITKCNRNNVDNEQPGTLHIRKQAITICMV